MPTPQRFVALLRGINIGGHKQIRMADLRQTLARLGYEHAVTLLASGNAIFDAATTDTDTLADTIAAAIARDFGHDVSVIVRPHARIQAMVAANPFAAVEVTDDTRLYVTFLAEPPASPPDLPLTSLDGSYRIIAAAADAVFSVLTLTPGSRTVDAMDILEKTYGANITTRSWNTVQKIAAK